MSAQLRVDIGGRAPVTGQELQPAFCQQGFSKARQIPVSLPAPQGCARGRDGVLWASCHARGIPLCPGGLFAIQGLGVAISLNTQMALLKF